MKRLIIILTALQCFVSQAQVEDKVILVDQESIELNKAYEQARKTLDSFIERATKNRRETEIYGAYVKWSEGTTVEFLWVTDFKEYKKGVYIGAVISEPQLLKKTKKGATLGFYKQDIYDWQYYDKRTDKTYGAFTHEPLRKIQEKNN